MTKQFSPRLADKFAQPDKAIPTGRAAETRGALTQAAILQTLHDIRESMKPKADAPPASYMFKVIRGEDGLMEAVLAQPITKALS